MMHLLLYLLFVALISAQPIDRLCPSRNATLSNCTTDGYTVTFAIPAQASDACTRLGLNIAQIDPASDTAEEAVQALSQCSILWAIVASDNEDERLSLNQQPQEPQGQQRVNVLTKDGVLIVGTERDYCGRNVRVAVLCEQPLSASATTTQIQSTSMTSTLQSTATESTICSGNVCGDGQFALGMIGTAENATCPLGYELAMVNITNIQQASSVLANCTNTTNSTNTTSSAIGPRAAWVSGWNQDDYRNQTCLVLTLGSASSGVGTIVPAGNCTLQYPPLCLRKNTTTKTTTDCNLGPWKIVPQLVGYAAAEAACACHPGYELANVTQPNRQINKLFKRCCQQNLEPESEPILWIKNVKGGKCAAVLKVPGINDLWYPSYGVTERACSFKTYPLCKRKVTTTPCTTTSSLEAMMSSSQICPSTSCESLMMNSESVSATLMSASESAVIISESGPTTSIILTTSTSCVSITGPVDTDEYMSRRGPVLTTDTLEYLMQSDYAEEDSYY